MMLPVYYLSKFSSPNSFERSRRPDDEDRHKAPTYLGPNIGREGSSCRKRTGHPVQVGSARPAGVKHDVAAIGKDVKRWSCQHGAETIGGGCHHPGRI